MCGPIAHPVLLESQRGARCSYCFRSLRDDDVVDADARRHPYRRLHRHCSPGCEKLDGNRIDEERASRRLPSPPSPTALSCSRILRRFDAYDELCHEANTPSGGEGAEGEAHLAILAQCRLFLLAMGDESGARLASDLIHPDATRAACLTTGIVVGTMTSRN